MMSERDRLLLECIDDMIRDADSLGLCRVSFEQLKREVLYLMYERNAAQGRF